MRSRTFVPSRVGATLVALLVVAFALAQVPASGSAGGGVNLQAAPPTAATVPPERTVPRTTTAHRTTTRKKVVRKSVTTVKQATTALKSAKSRQQAVEDLLWVLLNSKEFVFNH